MLWAAGGGHPAFGAQKLTPVKVTLANPIFNPGIAFLWIGSFMGWYEEEGVDAQFMAAQGEGQSIGWAEAGRTDIAVPRAFPVLFRLARGESIGVTGVYLYNNLPIYEGVAVPPGSPIKSICDLKDKKVGILAPNDAGIAFLARALQDCGLKAADVTFLPTGVADKSAAAMKLGRVDAWASVDVQYSLAQAQGFEFRFIPYGKFLDDLFDNLIWVNQKFFRQNRQAVVGYLRGLAKGSIFFYTNVDASLQIHWTLYPESLPKGMSREEAMRIYRKVLESRAPKLQLAKGQSRFGEFSEKKWEAYVKFLNLENQIPMEKVKTLWTNDLIAEANNFDPRQIEHQARTFNFEAALKKYKERMAARGN
ncbi:MAG: ABC transporter substrate-binding protein [Nitrospinota bacterium]